MTALIRALFCIATATLAAAFADPLVEWASNSGLFGAGQFTDRSNLDVVPALCVAGALALAIAFLRARATLLRNADRAVTPHAFRLMPVTFALQIFVLFLMETLEQVVVYGHPIGGTLWLGAPVLISLLAHAIACVFASWATVRALHALASGVVRLIVVLRGYTAISAQPQYVTVRPAQPVFALPTPVVCRIGERGPPLLNR